MKRTTENLVDLETDRQRDPETQIKTQKKQNNKKQYKGYELTKKQI